MKAAAVEVLVVIIQLIPVEGVVLVVMGEAATVTVMQVAVEEAVTAAAKVVAVVSVVAAVKKAAAEGTAANQAAVLVRNHLNATSVRKPLHREPVLTIMRMRHLQLSTSAAAVVSRLFHSKID